MPAKKTPTKKEADSKKKTSRSKTATKKSSKVSAAKKSPDKKAGKSGSKDKGVEKKDPDLVIEQPITMTKTNSSVGTDVKSALEARSRQVGTGATALAAVRASGSTSQDSSKDSQTQDFASVDSTRSEVEISTPINDPVRFSVRRDLESGSGGNLKKILIYIVVVVVIGMGAIYLVENYVRSQDSNVAAESETDNNDIDVIPEPTYENISIVTAASSNDIEGSVSSNSDYDDVDLVLGSGKNSVKKVKISELKHQVFSTFTRTTFSMTGLVDGLPGTSIKYNEGESNISVNFSKISANEELLQKVDISSGNVMSIEGMDKSTSIEFSLELEEASKFSAIIDGDNLYLDVKTIDQLLIPTTDTNDEESISVSDDEVEPEPDPEPVEAPVTETTSGAPDSPHFDNDSSQEKQYVVSNVSTKSLINETYFYRDDGSSFLFSWGIRGVGKKFIPNATAELIEVDGKDFIEVKINNLKYDLLHSGGKEKANITLSTSGTPLNNVFTHSYKSGKGIATYRVELSRKTDYKLHSTLDFDGYQLLTLEVFD